MSAAIMKPRVPPSNINAEQNVLGAVMIAPDALLKVGDLSADDFYRRNHQTIWKAICELDRKGKPFDAVTLGEWFESQGASDMVDGGAYLVELAANTISAANVRAYADIVQDKARVRRLIDVANHAIDQAYGLKTGESDAVVDATIVDLMALQQAKQECEFTMKQAMSLAWNETEAAVDSGKLRGITTGFNRIDARFGGFHNGDLVLIGARPSMGKTALAVNLALNAAAAGHRVGFISGEQAAAQIGQRCIAADSRVAAERLRSGDIEDEDWSKLTAAISLLNKRSVRIYDRSAPTLDELCRVARRWKQQDDIEVLLVDYLQRITVPKAGSRIDEVAEVARGLKTLARDLDIPVIALAQVKGEVDKRTGSKRPNLGDVANSDEATREADLIGFLYRGVVYGDQGSKPDDAELNFEKNRHGPTGRFFLKFDAPTMKFSDPNTNIEHTEF